MEDCDAILNRCFNEKRLNPLLEEAYKIRISNFSNVIYFYTPGMVHFDTPFHKAINPYRFPAISVTGRMCYLNCEHCRGKLLETMIPASHPEELFNICKKVKRYGGYGCLISGGSLRDGRVPLKRYIPTIKRVKQELGLEVVVHTGLIDRNLAEELASAGVDGVMLDIIGSDETIREVCHLNRSVQDYEQSLILLEEYDIPSIPHIIVGLHYGSLKGERTALKIVYRRKIAALVIVVLMPLSGTSMENVTPPSPGTVTRILIAARLLKPNVPLLLGCARPRGPYKAALDVSGVRAGVNGIAYPTVEAYQAAVRLGLSVKIEDRCCSLLWKDLITVGEGR